MPAALLFDLDGTLLDTAPEFTECLNQLLNEEGRMPITLEELSPSVSYGAKGMIEYSFAIDEKHPHFNSLKQRFLALYSKRLGFKTRLYPGIEQILASLNKQGIPWGIVTNKSAAYTLPLVQQFKALIQARCVVSGDTLTTQKPDPAPLLHACKTLQVPPEQCWFIGDAQTDVQASRAARLSCAIANYGYIPKNQDTLTWQADFYLAKPEDIAYLVPSRYTIDLPNCLFKL